MIHSLEMTVEIHYWATKKNVLAKGVSYLGRFLFVVEPWNVSSLRNVIFVLSFTHPLRKKTLVIGMEGKKKKFIRTAVGKIEKLDFYRHL